MIYIMICFYWFTSERLSVQEEDLCLFYEVLSVCVFVRARAHARVQTILLGCQLFHRPQTPSCENTLLVCWFFVANKVSLCGRAV